MQEVKSRARLDVPCYDTLRQSRVEKGERKLKAGVTVAPAPPRGIGTGVSEVTLADNLCFLHYTQMKRG